MTTKISTTRAMLAVLIATTGASPGILQPETDAVVAASFDPETCSTASVGSVGAKYKDKSICFTEQGNVNTIKGMCCKCCGIWSKANTTNITMTLAKYAHVNTFDASAFSIRASYGKWVMDHLDGDKAMSEKTCAVITKTYQKEDAFFAQGVNGMCELPYVDFIPVNYRITLPSGVTTNEVRLKDHVDACHEKFEGPKTDASGNCIANGLWLNGQGHTCYDLFEGPLAKHMPPPEVMSGWTDLDGTKASQACCAVHDFDA